MGGDFNSARCRCKTEEVKSRFAAGVEAAKYDHGHAGYSGTFAEKDSIEIIPNPDGEFWSEKDAEDHATEENDKWGPAGAYQLGEDQWLFAGWCSS